jgi:hypothetical protein
VYEDIYMYFGSASDEIENLLMMISFYLYLTSTPPDITAIAERDNIA